MLQRFASAVAVGAILVGVAAPTLYASTTPTLDGRYLLATIWCVVPLLWGVWTLLIPASWIPSRIPVWGAILGFIAGIMAGFVLDMPGRMLGAPSTTWTKGIVLVIAVVLYGVAWIVVKRMYTALAGMADAGE